MGIVVNRCVYCVEGLFCFTIFMLAIFGSFGYWFYFQQNPATTIESSSKPDNFGIRIIKNLRSELNPNRNKLFKKNASMVNTTEHSRPVQTILERLSDRLQKDYDVEKAMNNSGNNQINQKLLHKMLDAQTRTVSNQVCLLLLKKFT